MAVRDWLGANLKAMGDMIFLEEESEEGERDRLVDEILVRPHPRTLSSFSR